MTANSLGHERCAYQGAALGVDALVTLGVDALRGGGSNSSRSSLPWRTSVFRSSLVYIYIFECQFVLRSRYHIGLKGVKREAAMIGRCRFMLYLDCTSVGAK